MGFPYGVDGEDDWKSFIKGIIDQTLLFIVLIILLVVASS